MIMKTYKIVVFIVYKDYNALTLIAFFDYFQGGWECAVIPIIGIMVVLNCIFDTKWL